jgi:hypothetical protein
MHPGGMGQNQYGAYALRAVSIGSHHEEAIQEIPDQARQDAARQEGLLSE